jgi:hypothetical protein
MDYSQIGLLFTPLRRKVQIPTAWLDSRQISARGKIAIQSQSSTWKVAFPSTGFTVWAGFRRGMGVYRAESSLGRHGGLPSLLRGQNLHNWSFASSRGRRPRSRMHRRIPEKRTGCNAIGRSFRVTMKSVHLHANRGHRHISESPLPRNIDRCHRFSS